MGNLSLIKPLRRVFVSLFVILLIFLLIPLTILFILPLLLYRVFVHLLKKIFRPDLQRMLNPRSSIFAQDVLKEITDCNLVVSHVVDGVLNLEELIQEGKEKLLDAKTPSGEILLPELKQYIRNYGGFAWWKDEEAFRVEEHVQYYGSHHSGQFDPIIPEELLQIRTKLDRMPWPEYKSPWRILLIPNYIECPGSKDRKSVLLVQFHHSLSDGFSFLTILLKKFLNTYEESDIQAPHYEKKSLAATLVDYILYPLKAPYQFMSQVIKAYDINELRLPKSKLTKESWVASGSIPIQSIKEIKNLFRISFTSVLLAALAAGLRKHFKKNNMQIPHHLHMIVPFPIPQSRNSTRKDKLRNLYSFAFLRLPTGVSDPKERVNKVEQNIQFLKTSLLPGLNYIMIPCLGLMPYPIINLLFRNGLTTGILSNFPGTSKMSQLMGINVQSVDFSGGPLPGNTGVGFTMLSYNGILRINAIMDKSLCHSQDDVQDLLQFIMDEFDILKRHIEIV